MIRVEKILYTTDFSSYSNQAYFHAVALAESHGARLTVLFVYKPEVPPEKARAVLENNGYLPGPAARPSLDLQAKPRVGPEEAELVEASLPDDSLIKNLPTFEQLYRRLKIEI